MMGRAGRRGFDPSGNVVFLGFPRYRMERLLCASLPELRGNMPLSTTMVLRLVTALHESDDDITRNSIFKLLNTPFYCTGNESLKDQVSK
jgi:superfamily II RNA helicase